MASFKDCEGRVWEVRVTVAAVKRVLSLLEVDLLSIVEGKLIEDLIAKPTMVCDIVYAVCKPDAERLGITDEDFGEAMAGDPIEDATAALLEGIVNFFQNSRDRKSLRMVLAATEKAMNKARDLIESRLDSGVLEQVSDKALAESKKEADESIAKLLATAGDLSGSAPASSE